MPTFVFYSQLYQERESCIRTSPCLRAVWDKSRRGRAHREVTFTIRHWHLSSIVLPGGHPPNYQHWQLRPMFQSALALLSPLLALDGTFAQLENHCRIKKRARGPYAGTFFSIYRVTLFYVLSSLVMYGFFIGFRFGCYLDMASRGGMFCPEVGLGNKVETGDDSLPPDDLCQDRTRLRQFNIRWTGFKSNVRYSIIHKLD